MPFNIAYCPTNDNTIEDFGTWELRFRSRSTAAIPKKSSFPEEEASTSSPKDGLILGNSHDFELCSDHTYQPLKDWR